MVEDLKVIVKRYNRKQTITLTVCAAIVLLSGIAIGVGATILLAQNRFIRIQPPHKTADDVTNIITEKYGLDEQQTAKVKTLLNDMFNRERLRRNEGDAARDADAEFMIAQMKQILTDEQFVKWNENFAKLRTKFKQK